MLVPEFDFKDELDGLAQAVVAAHVSPTTVLFVITLHFSLALKTAGNGLCPNVAQNVKLADFIAVYFRDPTARTKRAMRLT